MNQSEPSYRCAGMPHNYYAQAISKLLRCRECGHEQRGKALRCPKCRGYMLIKDVCIMGEIKAKLRSKTTKTPNKELTIILDWSKI